MENAPDGGDGGGDGPEPLPYKTWTFRVSIHCGGCRKKVKKVLQSIEGVYKIEIDSKQHKVVVTGDVESGTLIKKLIRSGKTAELWTENDGTAGGDDGERKTDGPREDNSGGDSSGEEKGGGGAPVAAAQGGGGGGGGKKKKKKKKKKGNSGAVNAGGAPAPGGGGGVPPDAAAPGDQTNENAPRQHVFTYPQFYYPGPEYGMSYNTAAPPMAASYYTFPNMYYPTHSHFDPTADIRRHRYDDHGDDEMCCSIM